MPKAKQRRKMKKLKIKNRFPGSYDLKDVTPVLFYLHGNTGSRASDYRYGWNQITEYYGNTLIHLFPSHISIAIHLIWTIYHLFRIATCELIRGLGYHVLSFDYRGFGDSADVEPTESGVVMDARCVVG